MTVDNTLWKNFRYDIDDDIITVCDWKVYPYVDVYPACIQMPICIVLYVAGKTDSFTVQELRKPQKHENIKNQNDIQL
jgi:hypothetical protein